MNSISTCYNLRKFGGKLEVDMLEWVFENELWLVLVSGLDGGIYGQWDCVTCISSKSKHECIKEYWLVNWHYF